MCIPGTSRSAIKVEFEIAVMSGSRIHGLRGFLTDQCPAKVSVEQHSRGINYRPEGEFRFTFGRSQDVPFQGLDRERFQLTPRNPPAQPLENLARGIDQKPPANPRLEFAQSRPAEQFIDGRNLPKQRNVRRIKIGFVRLQTSPLWQQPGFS